MYYLKKSIEISAAHYLELDHESKCGNLHGHNWNITVYLKSKELDDNGMVEDFSLIKQNIKEKLDHKNLNEIFGFNPTAENVASWICSQIPLCYKVIVQECNENIALYERDNC